MATLTTLANESRLRKTSVAVNLLHRPEIGAAVAALIIFVYFSVSTRAFLSAAGISVWLYSASLYGIMSVAVGMLMIGGEFDLSAGVMTGTTGLIVGVLTTHWQVNIVLAMLLALVIALAIGWANAYVTMRTRLSSFIVTLATFFILQGINLAVTKLITGTVAIEGMDAVPGFNRVNTLFGESFPLFSMSIDVSIVWWILTTVIASWVLWRTRPGNWIFAVGGQQASAHRVGIPVIKVKSGLFMGTASAAWLVGMLELFNVSTVQATTGIGQEFIYIICAVVGGCLLTGGFGSAAGAAIGGLIYGMCLQGIVFAQWDSNWLKAFLGAMLLIAVLINLFVRKRAGASS